MGKSNRKHKKGCGCDKCTSTSSSSSSSTYYCKNCKTESSSSTCSKCKCECSSSSSSSTPPCEDLSDCKKVCFGHWGSPRCKACHNLKNYDECDYEKIPTGSIWFAWQFDPYGVVRSLSLKECWNRCGIIVKLKSDRVKCVDESDSCGCRSKECKKCYTVTTCVLSVWHGGRVSLVPLKELAYDKTIRRMGVRTLKATCNKCTDAKRARLISCLVKEYLGFNFERDGAARIRDLFNMNVINPNFDSLTDTKLVYTILFKAGLLKDNECCGESSLCCTEFSSGGSTKLTCESTPCSSTCCTSTTECPKCEIDCAKASQATLTDFLYDKGGDCGCLDLRWFNLLAEVWTDCSTYGHDEAVDKAFQRLGCDLLVDLRKIAGCWAAGRDKPCVKQCRECNKPRGYFPTQNCSKCCGHSSSSSITETVCTKTASESDTNCQERKKDAVGALNILATYFTQQSYANIPITTNIDGNYVESLLNIVYDALTCSNRKPYVYTGSTTQTYNLSVTLSPDLRAQQLADDINRDFN